MSATNDYDLWSAECLRCYDVNNNVTTDELPGYIKGETDCPRCGSSEAWWLKPIGSKRPQATDAAIKREMDRFDEALESWMLTPQGQFAQVVAERDRKGA